MRQLVIILLMFMSISCGYAQNQEKDDKFQTSAPSDDEKTLKDKYHPGNTRSIISAPVIQIRGNALLFINYIPSCTLQLVDETGNIFYEANIPEGTERWQLPTDQLAGCELRLIIDDVCYYCVL